MPKMGDLTPTQLDHLEKIMEIYAYFRDDEGVSDEAAAILTQTYVHKYQISFGGV